VGDTVATLIRRVNRLGLAALDDQPRAGRRPTYTAADRERIVREFRRIPEREQDGTATWSLATLQRALRRAPDGLPHISTFTILQVLHDAGYTWQRTRTWCETGGGAAQTQARGGPGRGSAHCPHEGTHRTGLAGR
jgi:transposase